MTATLPPSPRPAAPRPRTLALALLALATTAAPAPASPVPVDRRAIEADWALQDYLYADGRLQVDAVKRVIDELGPDAADLLARWRRLADSADPDDPTPLLELYHQACRRRRVRRLAPYRRQLARIVFTKHANLGGSHYAYTEGQSDAQHERHFSPGSALCLLEINSRGASVTTLLADPSGLIRDPDVSYDGQRILFAWKKSLDDDDFHLYEMTLPDRRIVQLTFGKALADYEGCYLPDGAILFNSTRCVQTVDCWWTEVSNLYRLEPDGRLRRLTFDQVHDNYPTVTPDGRVIYTRWDYNDRGQIFPQGLFHMNPDGTAQRALYGNNSWFPTTILHARGIPGSRKIVAILTGHHTHQHGQLALIDPARGRQENAGVQLIAPPRPTPAVRVDAYGQQGPQFEYPYPLDEQAFLVSMDPIGSNFRKYPRPFALYWIDRLGRRELLASDPKISCNQPVPLQPRPIPPQRPCTVDLRKNWGTYYVQDIYTGPGLAGLPRGSIAKIRVIEIGFRAAGIGSNSNRGPAGRALVSTPVAIGNGCWDTKTILGQATVYPDGSACFTVPANRPLYFQAIDHNGHAAQTMRSWATLQPGESRACLGCHESPNHAPPPRKVTLAMQHGPQPLEPFLGRPPRGFSFPDDIQPILNRHCISCHNDPNQHIDLDRPTDQPVPDSGRAFSLLDSPVIDHAAARRWSTAYLALTGAAPANPKRQDNLIGRPNRWVNWLNVQSPPTMLEPYHAGSARSDLMTLLRNGHGRTRLSQAELHTLAAWIDLLVPFCGSYTQANAWSDKQKQTYRHFLEKRRRLARLEIRPAGSPGGPPPRSVPATDKPAHSAGP